jgi:hypothetical protein
MISIDSISFSILFKGFVLEFILKLPESIHMSRRFSNKQEQILFAVVEIWLLTEGDRELVIDARMPSNFLQESILWMREISSPLPMPQLHELLPRGGWCRWMINYWANVEDDAFMAVNEDAYSQLVALSLAESQFGHIGIYTFEGLPTIEVATRSSGYQQLAVWAPYNPVEIASDFLRMRRTFEVKLLNELTLPNASGGSEAEGQV